MAVEREKRLPDLYFGENTQLVLFWAHLGRWFCVLYPSHLARSWVEMHASGMHSTVTFISLCLSLLYFVGVVLSLKRLYTRTYPFKHTLRIHISVVNLHMLHSWRSLLSLNSCRGRIRGGRGGGSTKKKMHANELPYSCYTQSWQVTCPIYRKQTSWVQYAHPAAPKTHCNKHFRPRNSIIKASHPADKELESTMEANGYGSRMANKPIKHTVFLLIWTSIYCSNIARLLKCCIWRNLVTRLLMNHPKQGSLQVYTYVVRACET